MEEVNFCIHSLIKEIKVYCDFLEHTFQLRLYIRFMCSPSWSHLHVSGLKGSSAYHKFVSSKFFNIDWKSYSFFFQILLLI